MIVRPVAAISGAGAIYQHLDELCDYAHAHLLPTASQHRHGGRFGFEAHVRQLPAFLLSFADLVAPLPQEREAGDGHVVLAAQDPPHAGRVSSSAARSCATT